MTHLYRTVYLCLGLATVTVGAVAGTVSMVRTHDMAVSNRLPTTPVVTTTLPEAVFDAGTGEINGSANAGTDSSSSAATGSTSLPSSTSQGSPPSSSNSVSGVVAADVAKHHTPSNCWLIISGKVYNVTSWISQHPGGSNSITSRCGTDSTTAFNSNVGGGHNHSSYARSLLASYYVNDVTSGASSPTPATSTTDPVVTTPSTPPAEPAQVTEPVVAPAVTRALSVSSANGIVISSPAGISCGSSCGASFTDGASIVLSATPASGFTFTGWSGACAGTGSCTVLMNGDKAVTANYAQKTVVAPPASGYSTADVAGACSGTGTCTLTMGSDQVVLATFDVQSTTTTPATNYTLSVTSLNGTVTSNPSGILCGATCSAAFASGTSVTLTAVAPSGYTFSGWSGACSGTGVCSVTLSSNQSVTATYTQSTTGTGTGTGTGGAYTSAAVATHNTQSNCWIIISGKVYNVTAWISQHPGGSNSIISRCGTDSTTAFNTSGGGGHNHSSYARSLLPSYYVGDLSTGTTTTTTTYTLTVSKSGNGGGTISGGGISCGTTCSVTVASGTTIALTATADSASVFNGWFGSCGGTGACSIVMDSDLSVAATFNAFTGTGTAGGSSGGTTGGGTTGGGTTGGGTGGSTTPTTYTVHVTSAGNYDVTNLSLNAGDSITFIYSAPFSGEVRTRFTPTGISSITLDQEITQRTVTFSNAGTWTFTADDHSGNSGTVTVQ